MLSLEFIYQHPDVVREALRRRRDPRSIDEILRLVEQRRALVTRSDGLYAALKQAKEAAHRAPVEQRAFLNQQVKAITKDLRPIELQISDISMKLQPLLLELPNLPQRNVPEGDRIVGDQVVRYWGEAVEFHFRALPHWELGERLGILDAEGGVRVAGSRFVTLRGAGARLERALISFMLDTHTQRHGYTEVMPPQLVKRSVMQGAGQLPKFEGQAFVCQEDELYLNPTAEVPLVGLYTDTILPPGTLPVRAAAWTTAFRREVGSAAHQNRGLLRLHQFNKIELFQIVAPDESDSALEQMVQHAEMVLRLLELPYRVVELCTGSLPFSSARTYDLEVWMPGIENYVEISSISNCESFQARRANIKFRASQSTHSEYVHTLNASGLAVGRTMAALLEIYQQADGTVIIPKVLRPYMNAALIGPAVK